MILALFFTKGGSLKDWLDKGLFDREKLIYEKHLNDDNLKKIYWFTYGKSDLSISNILKKNKRLNENITICQMPKYFPSNKIGFYIYSLTIPFIYFRLFKSISILKTNQMNGSWSAILVKKIFKTPLIIRTGYTLSIFRKKANVSKLNYKFVKFIENFAYKEADISVVSSKNDEKYIINKYNINKNTVHVLHNYIDTKRFLNKNLNRNGKRFVFVGRLSKQKNIFELLDAVSFLKIGLDIYGEGELGNEIEEYIKNKNIDADLKGIIENSRLPEILNGYMYYILPSLYEGMPKTLLEAMGCGCICIGTNVEGINEVITDGFNGYLIENYLSSDIINKINIIRRTDNSTLESIVCNGVAHIENEFSLDSIVKKEKILFDTLRCV